MPKVDPNLPRLGARVADLEQELRSARLELDRAIVESANTAGTDSLSAVAAAAGISRQTLYAVLQRHPGLTVVADDCQGGCH